MGAPVVVSRPVHPAPSVRGAIFPGDIHGRHDSGLVDQRTPSQARHDRVQPQERRPGHDANVVEAGGCRCAISADDRSSDAVDQGASRRHGRCRRELDRQDVLQDWTAREGCVIDDVHAGVEADRNGIGGDGLNKV